MQSFLVCLLVFVALAQALGSPTHAVRPIDQQLSVACRQGQIEVVRKLVLDGADVNARGEYDNATPLIDAATHDNNGDIITFLVEQGAHVNATDSEGETALMKAAEKGLTGNIDLLLKLGANLEQRDKTGKTALFHSADHIVALNDLLDHHANINARDNDGRQPIREAARRESLACVQALVSQGADINSKSNNGGTPLLSAMEHCNLKITEYLIAKGANPNVLFEGRPGLTLCISCADELDYLLDHGADVNAHGRDGWTALHVAANKYGGKVVRQLISHGANVNARTTKGETPFMMAAQRTDGDYDREDVITLLIQAGARDAHMLPRKPDILIAANSDEAAVIQSLMDHGTLKGQKYWLCNRDTISGTGAARSVTLRAKDDSTGKFIKDLKSKMTPQLLSAFLRSNTPSKVIPPLPNTPGSHYERDRVLQEPFKDGGSWPDFYKRFPGASGIEYVSSQIFDRARGQAIIYYQYASDGMAAGGYLILLKKSGNTWKAVQSVGLWVS